MKKLNLGCGVKYVKGFINVDKNKKYKADKYFNISKEKWPFKSNTFDLVNAHHILEHIGKGYFHFWKELYRVCRPNATVDIKFPHHMGEIFYADPTHKRFITMTGLEMFNATKNLEWIKLGYGTSPLGLDLKVNFEIISTGILLFEQFRNDPRFQEINAYSHLCNVNIIEEVHVVMKVNKEPQIST